MTNLVSTLGIWNTNLGRYSGTGERLWTADQLPSQNYCDSGPDFLWEPPVVLDEEAEAAYKIWQESLSYLQEDIERV
jgi:hypothetical protein